MRARAIGCAALLCTAWISTSAGASVGVRASPPDTIKCHVEDHIQSFPTASSPGKVFSFVRCPAPFGRGISNATFRLFPKTSTTGTAVLKFKAYFNTGTVSGVWHATYRYTNPTTGLFDQKVTWTKGTGAFQHIKASGVGHGVQRGSLGEIDQTLTVTSF